MSSFSPSGKFIYGTWQICGVNFFIFCLYYSDSAAQLIFLAVFHIAWMFNPFLNIYGIELSKYDILEKFLMTAWFFMLIGLFATILKYIITLHDKIVVYNSENIKLLDGMHEGLLILSSADRKVLFSNKPSQKLLTCALNAKSNVIENSAESDNDRLLRLNMFLPI